MSQEPGANHTPLDEAPPPYTRTATTERPVRTISHLPVEDPDLARAARAFILISVHGAPSQSQASSTAYYRCRGQLVSEPLTLSFDDLRQRLALDLAPAPASLAQSLGQEGTLLILPVHWALASVEERRTVEENPDQLLSLRHPLRPVWKWSKAGRTGPWRASLDDVLGAGWWEAGNGLDLVVCGVESHRATELQSKWVQVFPLMEFQIEEKD